MPLVHDDPEIVPNNVGTKPPRQPKNPPASSGAGIPHVTPAPTTPTVTPTTSTSQVADEIGMMTGALTTVTGLFDGPEPDTSGLTAPNQVQTEVIESLSISPEDKKRLLSGLSPEDAKRVDEMAPYVDLPGGYRHRGNGSGWDAPLANLANSVPAQVVDEISDAAQADTERARRAKALGVDLSGASLNGKTPQAKEMTWEAYNALSDRERAAVDFNGMLTTAVNRDLRKSDKLVDKRTEDEVATYTDRVAAIFGEDGGSEVFAPETVALLDQIQFTDQNADLDDFLGLKTVIRGKDLKTLDATTQLDMPFSDKDIFINPAAPNPERAALAANLAESTGAMERAVAGSQALLDDITKMMAVDRQEQIDFFGGKPKPVNAPIGYGAGRFQDAQVDLDSDFKLVFDTLADAKNADKMSEILGVAKSKFDTVNPRIYGKFLDYVNTRSLQSLDYELPLGDNASKQYLTPDQFREKLGLAPKETANARR